MSRDEIFSKDQPRASDIEFNEEVADVFEDMLVRSIPFYLEQQRIITEVVEKTWIPGTKVYDLGCSIGTTLIRLGKTLGTTAQLVGLDYSEPMLKRARQNLKDNRLDTQVELKTADFNGDLSTVALNNASIVTLCWTLQFIRPLERDRFIKWIYDGLVEGGALIVSEKVLTNDPHMNRVFIDFYYDFKRRNGYSEDEILKKREALENVLVPYRVDENPGLFKRNGFQIAETFFQWYNFAGFLCIKKA